jgi:hypothetical protein
MQGQQITLTSRILPTTYIPKKHISVKFSGANFQVQISVGQFFFILLDYCIGSNFWKFYLIRTSFTLGEPVALVKVFRLFRLEWIVLVFTVWTQYVDVQYWQGQHVCDALLYPQYIAYSK